MTVIMMSRGRAEPGVKEQAREGSALPSSFPMAVTLAGHFAVQHVTVQRVVVRSDSDPQRMDDCEGGGAWLI